MPEYETKFFGRIQCASSSIIEFPAGLPGFEDQRMFVLVQQAVNRPLVFLQSLTRPELCFITLPARAVDAGFTVKLAEEEARLLGLPAGTEAGAGSDTLCLGIVALAEDGSATINLRAPLVVHCGARRAIQVIPEESSYSHRHPLAPQPEGAPCL